MTEHFFFDSEKNEYNTLQSYYIAFTLSLKSVVVFSDMFVFVRSTLRQSGPTKAGLKCPSVRSAYLHTYVCTSVCPQKVSLI